MLVWETFRLDIGPGNAGPSFSRDLGSGTQTHRGPRDANNGGKQDNDLQDFRPREGAKLPQGLTDDARIGLFFARM